MSTGVTNDSLLPTMEATMNVFESSKSYEMKKSIFTQSSAVNDEQPKTKTDSFLTVSERASQKYNDDEPLKVKDP